MSVWKSFAASCGLSTDFLPLHHYVMRWWSADLKNKVHKLLFQAAPIFICWNLWKNRCASRYAGKKSNLSRVNFLVFRDTFFLMKTAYPYITWYANWIDLVKLVEKCTHITMITPVLWSKPPDLGIKLNSNGSALSDGRMGAGGIIKDKNGELMLAYFTPLGVGSNNQAEVEAAVLGVIWCLHMGWTKVVLEVDSQLLYKWINQHDNALWQVHQSLTRLRHHIAQLEEFRFSNSVANVLAKHSHNLTARYVYFTVAQIPKEGKAYYVLDKAEMVAFRRRKLKRIKEPP